MALLEAMGIMGSDTGPDIGRQLAALRGTLSQEEAARRVGVSLGTWNRWETGRSVPYDRNLRRIADAFGVDYDELAPPADGVTLRQLEERIDRLDELGTRGLAHHDQLVREMFAQLTARIDESKLTVESLHMAVAELIEIINELRGDQLERDEQQQRWDGRERRRRHASR